MLSYKRRRSATFEQIARCQLMACFQMKECIYLVRWPSSIRIHVPILVGYRCLPYLPTGQKVCESHLFGENKLISYQCTHKVNVFERDEADVHITFMSFGGGPKDMLPPPFWGFGRGHGRIGPPPPGSASAKISTQTCRRYLTQHRFDIFRKTIFFCLLKNIKLIGSNILRCRKIYEFTIFINDPTLHIRRPEVEFTQTI